jgi:hypothetical protein
MSGAVPQAGHREPSSRFPHTRILCAPWQSMTLLSPCTALDTARLFHHSLNPSNICFGNAAHFDTHMTENDGSCVRDWPRTRHPVSCNVRDAWVSIECNLYFQSTQSLRAQCPSGNGSPLRGLSRARSRLSTSTLHPRYDYIGECNDALSGCRIPNAGRRARPVPDMS